MLKLGQTFYIAFLYPIYVILEGCRGKWILILIPIPFPHDSYIGTPSFENSHVGINFIESLWIGETRIHQKYGKLRNAIIWLPGGCGTWNFHIILITCSSKCIQNFKAFWDGDVFGSVKWYRMPRLHIIIAVSLLCSELLCLSRVGKTIGKCISIPL